MRRDSWLTDHPSTWRCWRSARMAARSRWSRAHAPVFCPAPAAAASTSLFSSSLSLTVTPPPRLSSTGMGGLPVRATVLTLPHTESLDTRDFIAYNKSMVADPGIYVEPSTSRTNITYVRANFVVRGIPQKHNLGSVERGDGYGSTPRSRLRVQWTARSLPGREYLGTFDTRKAAVAAIVTRAAAIGRIGAEGHQPAPARASLGQRSFPAGQTDRA